jgi:hypothetical protein
MAYLPDEAVLSASDISAGAFRLYAYFCMRRNRETGACKVSLVRAQSELKFKSYSHTTELRKELIREKWIEIDGLRRTVPRKGFTANSSEKTEQITSEFSEQAPQESSENSEHLTVRSSENSEPSENTEVVKVRKKPNRKFGKNRTAYKDEPTINQERNTQPKKQVEAGANAPRRARNKSPSGLVTLPPKDRNILEVWRAVTKRYPSEATWPTVLARLRDGFDPERLRRCGGAYVAYNGLGPKHVGGICDWYRDNITEPRGSENGANNGRTNTPQSNFRKPEVTRDLSIFPARS